jgi:mono/diheme cytochrome c family protein
MALKRLGFLNLAAVLVLGGAIVGFTANAAHAQDEGVTMGPSGRVISGPLQFREYCASCHGMDATGDGPVAASLKKKPANLTLLSKNNGCVYPAQDVHDFIDGSKTAAGHGTREMPLWGTAFMFRTGKQAAMGAAPLSQQEVNAKINRLVKYIETIQVGCNK